MAEAGKVGVDENESREENENQHVERVHHPHSPEHVDHSGEALDVPQQHPRVELQRNEEQHDDLVGHALHRVELVIDADVVRIGFAFEDAVAVIPELAKTGAEMFGRA